MEPLDNESSQSSPRMSSLYSELPSAKVQPERQGNLSFSTSTLQHTPVFNAEATETLTLLNGYSNHYSDSEESSSQEGDRDEDNDANDRVHDSDENDNDDDNHKIDCNEDEGCDNGDDNIDNDENNYDDNDNNNTECNDNYSGQDASYSRADQDVSVVSDKVGESVAEESSSTLRVNSGNDDEISNNESFLCRPGSNNNNISQESTRNRNDDGSRNENSYGGGVTTFVAKETNPPIASVASNVTSQGARPKTSSQTPLLSNVVESPGYYSGKIPSLEVAGINQRFLARHTTDQSIPYSSYTEDHDLPASQPTSFINCPQASITNNGSSTTPWSLPRPPFLDRSEVIQEGAYSGGVNSWYRDPEHVGFQQVASMTRLISGWQLSNQQQPQLRRTDSYFASEDQQMTNNFAQPWLTRHDEAPSHHRNPGYFPGTTGNQDGNSFDRQSWMPSGYESTWRSPGYGYNRYQTNHSGFRDFAVRSEPAVNSSAVNPPASAITFPSVTVPNANLNFPETVVINPLASLSHSSTMSGGVASNSAPLNAFSNNGQERVADFTTYRPLGRDNQENGRLISSETVSPRRQEESLRNYDALNLSQEGSQTSAPTEDNSLVALERKVAEACALVERVLKEREERTKRQREAAQRQREIREQRQREARETREREEREIRERAEREAREREENMAAEERAPVQESPLWQCEHYKRRCSVKFPCCGVFYPCHRCHNGSEACDDDDKKANQATHVKCGNCGHEDEINEGSQTCSNCGARMSEYFCFKCKHFTGVDKNPFHCEKCGICRIYRDRSFHCDVCNVCLDKRLEGKHKCRPDSGHDECCICLEDAFSGCQILPCSHKVHRECAIAMIQNGVRNCPICRHPLYSQDSQ